MLTFTWKRCLDGYETRMNEHGMPQVTPRSSRFAVTEPLQDDPVLYRQFAGAMAPEALVRFVNSFGLLDHPSDPEPVPMLEKAREEIALAVRYWTEGLAGDLERLINSKHSRFCEVTLQVRDSVPVFVPVNLRSAMWCALALAVRQNEQHRSCVRCGTFFRFGPGTGRRETALFCGSKCQQANAYEARKAAAAAR
jgi:hypothetical protein